VAQQEPWHSQTGVGDNTQHQWYVTASLAQPLQQQLATQQLPKPQCTALAMLAACTRAPLALVLPLAPAVLCVSGDVCVALPPHLVLLAQQPLAPLALLARLVPLVGAIASRHL
jgi:hypothetical protein